MNRSRAKAGNRAIVFVILALLAALSVCRLPARADEATTDYWFGGTRLIFEQPQVTGGALAISTTDGGLVRFLGALGATLAYQPGQKYVVITTADRRTVAFDVDSPRYTVGGIAQSAPFAPYASGNAVYLPFVALAKALYVDAVPDGDTTVLQPEIGSLDVRSEKRATVLTLRGATALHFKRITGPRDSHVTLSFSGVGSTLARERSIGQPALASVVIASAGTPKNPTTVVDFTAAPGSAHALLPSDSSNALTLEFAPPGATVGGTPLPAQGSTLVVSAPSQPRPAPLAKQGPQLPTPGPSATSPTMPSATPVISAAPVQLTALTSAGTSDGGFDMHVSLSGNVGYEWHRLPDDRWYVDLKPAVLAVAPRDESLQDDTVKSLRVKGFIGPRDHLPTVRIAFTLTSPRVVNLIANPGGATIAIDAVDDANPQRVGYGQITDGRLVASAETPAPLPPANEEPVPVPTGTWKFAPPPGYGSRLIVIDPGHGGSDPGAEHNGLVEKELNLDMARRLRALLVSRGWIVEMTRDSDIDVYEPNDSARDELQARDDIANDAHARLFISVHSNAAPSVLAMNGTTTYYYKPDSYAFARAVHARLAADLPTKDDGIIKDKFYVIAHATMPAILIESAFLTSARDAELLHDPVFLQKIALAIAEGVGSYTSAPPPVSQIPSEDGGR
ncbi:MAG: N-acetylmuramoyl-L-alanine amidase [Candidatus Eremiobacteraeota bacterium]|nr:N-acetylmuramoyl-L-alanine amidase [Candidatus Eremiobacteraeota bacterium]MBC5802792.1 N-acetylmuramoyl-L-alanine amidase [Candidatus Eremiobacteraeota bacterium]MBC5820545.1 N-acetylmuramoyl-L-alanine amidase [Candidatus Eremiobacteraeota bacterium]